MDRFYKVQCKACGTSGVHQAQGKIKECPECGRPKGTLFSFVNYPLDWQTCWYRLPLSLRNAGRLQRGFTWLFFARWLTEAGEIDQGRENVRKAVELWPDIRAEIVEDDVIAAV